MDKINLADYVDLARYPITRRDSDDYRRLLGGVHNMLAKDGCAVLPRFVGAAGVSVLDADAERAASFAWRSFNRTNVYFSKDDDSLPETHPARRFFDRSNAFVPADNFGDDSPLRGIYESAAFMPFIRAALQEDSFHRYADPLADVIVNVVEDGGGFPWHFDTNSYTVTLALRNADEGGMFEYFPNIRSATDENYESVARVLDEKADGVVSLQLQPGDLQIFRGRHSLHRVTPVSGAAARYVAIFSFAATPGMVASPERCRQLYGRVLPIHLQKAGIRDDMLRD